MSCQRRWPLRLKDSCAAYVRLAPVAQRFGLTRPHGPSWSVNFASRTTQPPPAPTRSQPPRSTEPTARPAPLGICARRVQNNAVAMEDAHMTTRTVATTSMLIAIACASFAACGKIEDELPPAVTTAVTHDFNQGDALRT